MRWTYCAAALLLACSTSSTPDASAPDVPPARDVSVDAAATPTCSRTGPRTLAPSFRGLSAPVEIYRDRQGIPHLYARNDLDVFFASGYAQATDRLFEMELIRRSASGTLAEVLGREKLAQDRLIRQIDIPRLGRESADLHRREHPETYALVDAWTAGINRRVAEINAAGGQRPPGFRATEFDFAPTRWSVDDAFAIGRLILFQNANQLEFDLLATIYRRYLPSAATLPIFQSLNGSFIVPPEERPVRSAMARRARRHSAPPRDFARRMQRFHAQLAPLRSGGSNNWAIDGRHSANGRPLLAGDPHQGLESPGVIWAQHMNSADAGGSFDVAGFSFVGTPGVDLGHNRRVAWTATTSFSDMMDLWEVPFTGHAISLGGREFPVEHCSERIAVRGEAEVTADFEDVPGQGVLLASNLTPVPVTEGDNRLLFGWTGFRPTHEADVFLAFDRAASVNDFDATVQRMETGAFNFIFADANGIRFRAHTLVPDRGDPRTLPTLPNAVFDGTDPRTVWTGAMLSPDRQPHSAGGLRGYLASSNNDPFGFTSNYRVDDDPFYYGVWFDPGTRAARIDHELTRLTTAGNVTIEQMEALQLDTHNVLADSILPPLFEAYGRVETDDALVSFRGDARLTALVEQLRAWNRAMDRDASAAVAYEGFQHFLARAVLADDVSITFDQVISAAPTYALKLTALVVTRGFEGADRYMQEGREVLLLRALVATRDWLTTRFGGTESSRYRWSDFHRSVIRPTFNPPGPFAVEPASTAGSIGTVNVSEAQFFDGPMPRRMMESSLAAVYRMVTSFDAQGMPHAVMNFAQGNSGDPNSPDWSNTQADWLAGTYRPLLFVRSEIEPAAREHTTLMP